MKKLLVLGLSLIPAFSYSNPFGIFSKYVAAAFAATGFGYSNYRFKRPIKPIQSQNLLAFGRITIDKIPDGTLLRMLQNDPKAYKTIAPQVAQRIDKMSSNSLLLIISAANGQQRDNYMLDLKQDPALCMILDAAKKSKQLDPNVRALLQIYFRSYMDQHVSK